MTCIFLFGFHVMVAQFSAINVLNKLLLYISVSYILSD